MLAEIVADAIKLVTALLSKLPADQRCEACRILELEMARQRVAARAERRFAEQKAKAKR